MSIRIGKYTAEGPYTSTEDLEDRSGVYTILTSAKAIDRWTVLDVGESHAVKSRVENHDRSDCWFRNNIGEIGVAVIYTPNQQQAGRRQIEQELRSQFRPVCGLN